MEIEASLYHTPNNTSGTMSNSSSALSKAGLAEPAPSNVGARRRKITFAMEVRVKQESQDEALVPLCAKSATLTSHLLAASGINPAGPMQKVPSLSDLSDPENSLDIPAQVPPLTPGTNKKMTEALKASFASWEKDQERLGIPKDPRLWSEADVSRWLNWAIKEFSLEGVVLQHFRMRGRDMCAMGKENFLARTPPFMGDILWEHLEILQKDVERAALGSVPANFYESICMPVPDLRDFLAGSSVNNNTANSTNNNNNNNNNGSRCRERSAAAAAAAAVARSRRSARFTADAAHSARDENDERRGADDATAERAGHHDSRPDRERRAVPHGRWVQLAGRPHADRHGRHGVQWSAPAAAAAAAAGPPSDASATPGHGRLAVRGVWRRRGRLPEPRLGLASPAPAPTPPPSAAAAAAAASAAPSAAPLHAPRRPGVGLLPAAGPQQRATAAVVRQQHEAATAAAAATTAAAAAIRTRAVPRSRWRRLRVRSVRRFHACRRAPRLRRAQPIPDRAQPRRRRRAQRSVGASRRPRRSPQRHASPASSGGVHEQSHGPAAGRRRPGAQRSPARPEQPQSDDGLAGVEARDPGVDAGRVPGRTTGQRAVLHWIGTHPAVAVSARVAHRQVVPELHLVDGRRLGVQAVRSGRGGAPLGYPQEQAQNELRETVARPALLLRQEHHSQDSRQAVRLPFRVRPSEPSWVHCGGVARLRRSQTRQEGRRVSGLNRSLIVPADDTPNQKTRSKNDTNSKYDRSRGAGGSRARRASALRDDD